ncbi:MAG: tRNA ((37)-N6)-dimethylallyltransferase MiaA [Pseudomonadota bacterium]|jgi:tRNA dimethylallyltransferase
MKENSCDKIVSVIFLMGPTASGKTDLAAQLIKKFPCEIISVDSALVYRGMNIGTAKPDAAFLATTPHHLIDICDPAEHYSAARFAEDARVLIQQIVNQGKIPLLVGGTGLYFRALQQGLSDLPAADPTIRERLGREAQEIGWAALHSRLAALDPVAAQRIHPNDPQRIQRALEVCELTDQPMSARFGQKNASPYRVLKLVIAPIDRDILRDRIARRFHQMLDAGFVEEVKQLFQRPDLNLDSPSMRSVGYRQVWQYLTGAEEYPQMVEKAIIATRQLAKRQLTWLRSEKDAQWFDSEVPDLTAQIATVITHFLNNNNEGKLI